MLRLTDAPSKRFFTRALVYNLLIAFFISGLLMLRADVLSFKEFYLTLAPTLIYTFLCGTLTTASMFAADRWCCGPRARLHIVALLGLGVIAGTIGEFLGSMLLILLCLKGPPGITPFSAPFWERVWATWIFVPLFIFVTLSFLSMVYGFELMRNSWRQPRTP